MIIKSLKLNNFRQYKGIQKIIFSTDKEKNVTVIKGENGSGKTTLLEAFTWCFYGKLTSTYTSSLSSISIELLISAVNILSEFGKVNFP